MLITFGYFCYAATLFVGDMIRGKISTTLKEVRVDRLKVDTLYLVTLSCLSSYWFRERLTQLVSSV